jgi:hypothetical protein
MRNFNRSKSVEQGQMAIQNHVLGGSAHIRAATCAPLAPPTRTAIMKARIVPSPSADHPHAA